jgi:endonuclease YncB( thermonuclease family)
MEVRDAVKLKLTRASKIELRNIRRDKYFRLLCDVYADDINIAAWLLASKFAKPYDGGTKTTWTEKDIP